MARYILVLVGLASTLAILGGRPVLASKTSDAAWLDVPFVPQTELLCGGASVTMVARYWGDREIDATDFASLVDRDAAGIRVDRLLEAVARRGWQVWSLRARPELVRHHLARGRPMIALIEDRPGRFHYVVVVAWLDAVVVAHDPARGPSQVFDVDEFEAAWKPSGHLALLLLPPVVRPAPLATPSAAPGCEGSVLAAGHAARDGDLRRAEAHLRAAMDACPAESAAVRELAGLRLREGRTAEARDLARRAVNLDPGDAHAWRVLATSQFLLGERHEALGAWNQVGEPRVDLIPVAGLTTTRDTVVSAGVGVAPGELLTVSELVHARRRLGLLPALAQMDLRYRPQPAGRADLEIRVRERPRVFRDLADAMWATGRSAVERHARVAVSSPTGGGEVWSGAWRWERHRPRVAVGLAAPRPGGGVWRLEAEWAGHRFARRTPPGEDRTESSGRVSLRREDWMTPQVRWTAGAGLERWSVTGGRYLALGVGLEVRDLADRRALWADTELRLPIAGGESFGRWNTGGAWRRPAGGRSELRLRISAHGVAGSSPLALWPRGDSGQAGALLLRAHPALEDGIVRLDRLGRVLAGSSIEVERELPRLGPVSIGGVMFADLARAWASALPGAGDTRLEADVGVGLRFDLPGRESRLRLDLARAVRSGGTVLSVGWTSGGPGW